MSSELTRLKRLLLKSTGAHFHFCVEYYLKNAKKSDFKSEIFFGEFRETHPEISVLLKDLYLNCNYSTFKKCILNLSDEVIRIKLSDSHTSYKDLADLSYFVSRSYLKSLLSFFDADDLDGSKKARFVYLFKTLEPIFLFPLSSANLSSQNLQRAKTCFVGYTCNPSNVILSYLDLASCNLPDFVHEDFEDMWLIREIRKSL